MGIKNLLKFFNRKKRTYWVRVKIEIELPFVPDVKAVRTLKVEAEHYHEAEKKALHIVMSSLRARTLKTEEHD